jgi:hypothetical protein
MSEKTFLVKIDDFCPINSMGWCVYDQELHKYMKCKNDMDNRPEWCPLVEVQEPVDGMVPANKKIWVEK